MTMRDEQKRRFSHRQARARKCAMLSASAHAGCQGAEARQDPADGRRTPARVVGGRRHAPAASVSSSGASAFRRATRSASFCSAPSRRCWAWRLAYVERLDAWLVRVASDRPPHRAGARGRARWPSACWSSGARYGSHAVAASDQSGYVSEAALWARGTPRIDVGFAATPAVAGREGHADAARLSHRRRRRDGADLCARPPAADGAGACSLASAGRSS